MDKTLNQMGHASQSGLWGRSKPAGELRRLLASTSRTQLLRSKLKLFCATCQRMEKVVDVFGTVAKLGCNHRREVEEGLKARIAKLEADAEREARQEETA